MVDLNDIRPIGLAPVRFDLDEIVQRLRGSAETWVPAHFPNGRRVAQEWRLANIQGGAPRKQGSCVITLKGEHAGDWIDFDDNQGGGPISVLEQATGLSGRALIEYAADVAGSVPFNGKRHVTAEAQRQPDRRQDTAREIDFILSRTAPLAGTIAETYLRSRGLVAPATEDLLFHADLTYWDTRTGHPAMVAVVRGRGGETVAIHRTYLAEDGSGKADLPKPRMMLGRVGGGAVRLAPVGDDGVVGIAEGIETALSVMQACPGLPVWAALSAGNIEQLGLPPAIRKVVILVDNDPTGAGLAAAERAARRFHGEGRRVWTALPPRVGDDFNDLLRRDGAEAIRAVVHAAVPWGGDGTAAKASPGAAAAEVDEVARTAATYPLPTVEGIDLRYLRTRKGAILVHRHAGKDKDGATIWRVVASPFGIPARLRYLDQDDAYGLRMLIRDMQGEPRAVDFPRAGLARQGAQDIRSALYAAGLRSYGDGDQVALAMLKAADPPSEILVVSRPGWHRLDGRDHPVFVTPAGHAIGDAPAPALELATHARYDTGRGSLDGWKTAAAAAASLKGCPHFVLGVLAGLAGVVQSLTGLDSCGLNLSGLSSSGKTMAQRLAVSAWTSTAVGAGLLQSMRSTENAIEVFAQAASGTVLALDELAHADGRAIAKLIYAIAGGQGKARMTAGAILKQRYVWSTYALLSSECSLEEKVRADGAAWIAGMAVRILDIDVTDVDRSVPAPTLKAIADVENHSGHAGPAFVERLVAAGLHHAPDALRDRILAEARRLAHANPDAARLRAATCLAVLLIVGQLAQDFDLLPGSIDLEAPVHWAWERFEKSSDAEALVPEEQAIARLRAWIAERWDVTIKSVDAGHESFDRKLNNREAVAWYDEVAIYVPTERLREAAGETLKTQLIVKALEERDLLARRHDAKRAAVRWVPKVGQLQCYALRREAFGRSSSTHGWSVVRGGED